MVDPVARGGPLRLSLGVFGEGLTVQSNGSRICNSRPCESRTTLNTFGPGVLLGLSTTRVPGPLFEARLALANHWGNGNEVLQNSSGSTVNETRGSQSLWSVTGHLGVGANLQSAAFYAFGEFCYLGAARGDFRGYGVGPGFGFSFGRNRLISFEAASSPIFIRDGYPDDRGNGFAIRGMIDFMALLPQPPRREPSPPTRSLRALPPVLRAPPPVLLPPPSQGQNPATVTIEGNILHYVGLIHFHFDSALIRDNDESYRTIAQVAAFLRGNPDILLVEIHGHTDDQGPDPYNENLSLRRAAAVGRALTDRGVDPLRLIAIGHGEREPLSRATTAPARALNRRVEFRIVQRR